MLIHDNHPIEKTGSICRSREYYEWILLTLSLKFKFDDGDICQKCWEEMSRQFNGKTGD